MNPLAQKIEALLFALGKPLSHTELSKMLDVDAEAVDAAVAELREGKGGIVLVDDGKIIELRVAGNAAETVEKARKEEYARDIGKAGLEALSVLLYRGASTRSQIDFVRGVNSSQTLRTLAMRGLIRKIQNPKDERSYLYEPTTELLSQMGIGSVTELPDYQNVQEKLEALEKSHHEAQSGKDEQETQE